MEFANIEKDTNSDNNEIEIIDEEDFENSISDDVNPVMSQFNFNDDGGV